MRVIETVRTSQCPRCGKPVTRCRCDLKKSIRQRTKCVYSYILPKKNAETEKQSSNEAASPQSFQIVIQNPFQETTTSEDTMLDENYIICPRCVQKLKRSRESQEVDPIANTVCQHCMLKAQIYKLKAEKRRLRAQHTKRTKKENKLVIIYISKKNQIALTESKPSCEEQDAVIETTSKETEMKSRDKQRKHKYSLTELNLLRANSMPTDPTKTQYRYQYEKGILTSKNVENIRFNALIAEANVSKLSAFPSACTISNLRELKHKIQPDYSRSQLSDICKTDQVLEKMKKPVAVLKGDKLTVSESQIMSYRFPNAPKKNTLHKRINSSELIRRTREELLDKEEAKKQEERKSKSEKEKKMNEREEKEKLEVKKEKLSDPSNQKDHKTEKEKISTKKHKEDDRLNQEKHQKEKGVPGITSKKRNLEEETAASKQKKGQEEAEKRKKKEEDETKKRRDEIEALKKQKAEEDRLKKEQQQKISNKKEEAEAAKKEKESPQVAKRKIEEEKVGFKKNKEDEEAKKSADKKKKEVELEKRQREDEKYSQEKRQFHTDSELMIFKLIKEHKVKRAEERTLLEEKNVIADRKKLTEMAKKKQEADKYKTGEEATGKQMYEKMKILMTNKESDRDMTLDEAKAVKVKKPKMTEIIIGDNIYQSNLPLPPDPLLQDLPEQAPLLFKKKTILNDHLELDISPDGETKPVEEKHKHAKTSDNKEPTDGVFRYALSDRSFIDKGWTVLPVEEVVRKMNVYRMRPAQPEFDWFERNKNKRCLEFDTGEKLAVFDDNGGCRWYYKNGRMALDYYNSEELNSQHRFVVYSNGEPDERGRSRPYTVLATFSHLGTGVVFDHGGKIRLKYNQTEGVLLDREIGPVTTWKWHSLNDPPVLRQVMINSKLSHKDQTILHLGGKDDLNIRKKDDMMIAIENENAIKEMRKKQSLDFKPFQIKTKVLKINENFSLKVLDQATIYLIFREGSANIKLNIGMLLDHHEIIDTDTAALGVVSNCVERFPAATDSIAALQRSVEHAQHFERNRTARDRMLRPPPPGDSAERLVAGLSRPLKVPLRTLSISQTASKINVGSCRCSRKPPFNLYYNSRLA